MLVDSLAQVVKDTTQKVVETISQKELLEQVLNLDNSFNGHMNLLLIIFGLGIALGGILVPLYVSFKQKKDFRELEKKFKKDLITLRKEMEIDSNNFVAEIVSETAYELEDLIKSEVNISSAKILDIIITQDANNDINNHDVTSAINKLIGATKFVIAIEDISYLNGKIELLKATNNVIKLNSNLTVDNLDIVGIKELMVIIIPFVNEDHENLKSFINLDQTLKELLYYADNSEYHEKHTKSTENPRQGSD